MTDYAIELQGVQKIFNRFVLGPLDLRVPKGSIFGLVGPNAAGKTTTIDLLLGIGKEDRGEIRVLGLDRWKDEVALKRRIGYVSPDISYQAWGKVKRVLAFVSKLYPDWDHGYCAQLMETFGLNGNDKISHMSFGSKIKLALLIALSHKPELLLLDEPTMGIDAVTKQQVFSELLNAVQSEERTVLISSHGLSDIERFADRLGFIINGKLTLEGDTADLIGRYRMVDFIHGNGAVPTADQGVYVVHQDGERWRALIDTKERGEAWLSRHSVRETASNPVTLEELFVALAKGA